MSMNLIPGILLCFCLALPAWYLGSQLPLIGGPVFGILFGMVVALWKRPENLQSGISFTGKKLLQWAIILLGFEMNLYHVFSVGSQSLWIMVFTLSAAFLTAWLAGSLLKVDGNNRILIGVGTAICGGSAIAATAPVIGAKDKEIAYSISTIFLFNIAAVFLFPAAGHWLGLTDSGFGMWAGTAINDTSSVVAAGYSYSHEAGNFATIVKLTRTLMIIPITFALSLFFARNQQKESTFSPAKVFPMFVLGFLAAALINTSGLLPAPLPALLTAAGKFLIITAMCAIGLNTHLRQLIKNGIQPILLGLSCWAAVALVSLFIQRYMGLW